MIPEKYRYGMETFWEWRCVSCGEVIDPLILANRAKQNLRMDRHHTESSPEGKDKDEVNVQ
jgi:hypothetical protein